MKFLFDLLPVILFFATYKVAGSWAPESHELAQRLFGGGIEATQAPILLATLIAILATFGQIAWVRMRHGKIDKMLWISLGVVTLFGGATLFFHDPTFIKWKPTVLYWVFASVLAASTLVLDRNLIKAMLEAQITLPEHVWWHLSLAWAGFFLLMGALNLYVAFNFSEEVWVNFKLFGGMGLMLAFVLGQGFYLSRFIEEETH
jgi:intracellular septation protein